MSKTQHFLVQTLPFLAVRSHEFPTDQHILGLHIRQPDLQEAENKQQNKRFKNVCTINNIDEMNNKPINVHHPQKMYYNVLKIIMFSSKHSMWYFISFKKFQWHISFRSIMHIKFPLSFSRNWRTPQTSIETTLIFNITIPPTSNNKYLI